MTARLSTSAARIARQNLPLRPKNISAPRTPLHPTLHPSNLQELNQPSPIRRPHHKKPQQRNLSLPTTSAPWIRRSIRIVREHVPNAEWLSNPLSPHSPSLA